MKRQVLLIRSLDCGSVASVPTSLEGEYYEGHAKQEEKVELVENHRSHIDDLVVLIGYTCRLLSVQVDYVVVLQDYVMPDSLGQHYNNGGSSHDFGPQFP